jgi:hypothetical protein
MEPTRCATSIQGDREVIGLEGCRQPAAHFGSVIENDLLGHAKPEQLLEKLPVGFNVFREEAPILRPRAPCGRSLARPDSHAQTPGFALSRLRPRAAPGASRAA